MYRESPTAIRRKKEPGESFLDKLAAGIFHLAYFTLLPIILTVAINWMAYSFTAHNFYRALWMSPALLILSTFLAGALIRQRIEDAMGGMGLFVLGILALCLFAGLTFHDIQKVGGVYSQLMPSFLLPSVESYVYMLPGVGVMGMLFYKYFTLKHYN